MLPLSGDGVLSALFFHRFRLPFVASDDIHLVTFDDACKLRFGFEFDHARTQLGGHLMNIVFVQTEFLRNLLIRQVET